MDPSIEAIAKRCTNKPQFILAMATQWARDPYEVKMVLSKKAKYLPPNWIEERARLVSSWEDMWHEWKQQQAKSPDRMVKCQYCKGLIPILEASKRRNDPRYYHKECLALVVARTATYYSRFNLKVGPSSEKV